MINILNRASNLDELGVAIDFANKHDAYLVVFNSELADSIKNRCNNTVFTYRDILTPHPIFQQMIKKSFVIHDLAKFVNYVTERRSGQSVIAGTIIGKLPDMYSLPKELTGVVLENYRKRVIKDALEEFANSI